MRLLKDIDFEDEDGVGLFCNMEVRECLKGIEIDEMVILRVFKEL